MPSTKRRAVSSGQNQSAVAVSRQKKVELLTEILLRRHVDARRGGGVTEVQRRRKKIQQGDAKPVEIMLSCLEDNGLVDEFISTLHTLYHAGETPLSLIDATRELTALERELAGPVEDVMCRTASSRDLSMIREATRTLADEALMLGAAATLAQVGELAVA